MKIHYASMQHLISMWNGKTNTQCGIKIEKSKTTSNIKEISCKNCVKSLKKYYIELVKYHKKKITKLKTLIEDCDLFIKFGDKF